MSELCSHEVPLDEEFYFQWHITGQCNSRCKHCYHSDYMGYGDLPLSDLVRVCDLMDNAVRIWGKKGSLSLTGGEPFIREKELFFLTEHIENVSEGIRYYDILTNGSLLNSGNVNKLAEYTKLRRVQLSLEGPNAAINDMIRGDGAFDKTLKAVELLKSAEITVSIMMTLGKHNLDFLRAMPEFLRNIGVDTFAVERFIPEGRGQGLQSELLLKSEVEQAYRVLHEEAIKGGRPRILLYRPLFAQLDPDNTTVGAMCSVGTNALTVMPDGTVYPCRRLPITLGNALHDGFFKIWYDSELLWKIRDCNNLKGKCFKCQYLNACRGCRAMAYAVNSDYLAEDPHCWL